MENKMGAIDNRSWKIEQTEHGIDLKLEPEATVFSIKYSLAHLVKHRRFEEDKLEEMADFIFHMLKAEINAPLCECGKTLLHTEEGKIRVCLNEECNQ